jgi:large subunit ribosomal protein L5
MNYVPAMKTKYRKEIVPQLMEQFQFKSIMQVPRLEKIVINRGVGAATQDKKIATEAAEELTMISGQKAVLTKARLSISNFKLREDMPIGARVTLRNDRMYEFLERLVTVALPRVRDFRGVNKKLDGRGNYTMGITEQIIFPEIDIEKTSRINGMDITFVTNTDKDEEAFELLRLLGIPFKK